MLGAQEQDQSVIIFPNDAANILRQLQETQRPVVLTVSGRAEAVVLDMTEYERLLDLAALASEEEGIHQGEEDIRMGRTRPAREVLEEIRLSLGIPR